MAKHTKKRNQIKRKTTQKRRKTQARKISNPSGLSHLYTSLYGPRAFKGGFTFI
jgi:hypothetical protein